SAVIGIVSTNVKYGRIHEYGFSGTVAVRESLRQVNKAFGRPIQTREVAVRAHSRRVNLPARSFLRSALHDLADAGVIQAEIDAPV
ncbi:hypothetical protein ABTH52_20150, partial [Acinetobacter baumannii]